MGTKQKLPKGVTKRSNSANLYIEFSYRNIRCRESMKGYTDNKRDIAYCQSLLSEINRKIIDGSFKYADYFPNSRHLKKFGSARTLERFSKYRTDFLSRCARRKLEPSTLKGYTTCANRLAYLDDLPVEHIGTPTLKNLVEDMKYKQNLTNKSVANTMSVLSSMLDLAVMDEVISQNVCKEFKWRSLVDKESTKREKTVDPFSPQEIQALLSTNTYPQITNLAQFMLYTGMRPSEVFALTWQDIDFVHGTAVVNKASVIGKLKQSAKTKKGNRTHVLEPEALDALQAQKQFTFLQNKHIFLKPYRSGHKGYDQPFTADNQLHRYWQTLMQKSGVRYRYPYQCRHTYACMQISKDKNLFWIADQMGHEDPSMLFRHYGSFMEKHAQNVQEKEKFAKNSN